MKDRKNALFAGILAIIATLTHFAYFGYPLSVVFDETYFLKFIGLYWNHSYFFDVHPPLGKLLFVLFAWITGITPSAEIGTIHTAIDASLTYFRLLPMIAGILLPIVVFYICRRLNISRSISFLAGALICVENSLLVQSRFVLIEPLLVLAGFVFLWWYLIHRDARIAGHNRHSWTFLILSALALACTVSIKWNGLFFIFPVIAFELYDLWNWKKRLPTLSLSKTLARLAGRAGIYIGITALVYTLAFAAHFALLTKTGPGVAFMSERFQKTLEGNKHEVNPTLVPPGFFGKFFELNVEMYESHTRMTKEHDYASKYYTWPSMQRPIYYWHEQATTTSATDEQMDARIYLIGNPLIYWFGTASIVCMIVYAFMALIRRKPSELYNKKALFFITIAYLGNMLPYILIGRVMFLYHYEAALVVSIMGIVYLFEVMTHKKIRVYASIIFLVIAVVLFFFFSPLTYGTFMTKQTYEQRAWFKSWK